VRQAAPFGKCKFGVYLSSTISVQIPRMSEVLQLAWFWVLVVTLALTPILILTGQL